MRKGPVFQQYSATVLKNSTRPQNYTWTPVTRGDSCRSHMAGAQWQVAALLALTWTLTLLYGEWLQYSIHAPLCRDLLPRRVRELF